MSDHGINGITDENGATGTARAKRTRSQPLAFTANKAQAPLSLSAVHRGRAQPTADDRPQFRRLATLQAR